MSALQPPNCGSSKAQKMIQVNFEFEKYGRSHSIGQTPCAAVVGTAGERWFEEVIEEGCAHSILQSELVTLSQNRSQAEVSKGITDLSNKRVTKVLGKTVEFYKNWPPISRRAQ